MQSNKEKEFKWYALYCISNQENKVANLIKTRMENAGLSDSLDEIIIPTQEKVTIKKGQRKTVNERFLQGYMLIKVVLDDKTWPLIRDTQGVINFVGTDKKPTPLPESEVKSIIDFSETQESSYKLDVSEGDTVKVIEGEFKDFTGTIETIDYEKGKLRVILQFLGREVPVELDVNYIIKQ
jgi:transcriptional antiterminator NusG